MKRIGMDMDGVLSDFNVAYVELTVKLTGRNLFPCEWWTSGELVPLPPTWYYPAHYGYLPEEDRQVWDHIKASKDFWRKLPPYQAASNALAWNISGIRGDVYFVTSRPGHRVKEQTEDWLTLNSSVLAPTVLISEHKGHIAYGLGLHAYIDDKYENIEDVVKLSPHTHAYLLDAPYNRKTEWGEQLVTSGTRISSVDEFFEAERLL